MTKEKAKKNKKFNLNNAITGLNPVLQSMILFNKDNIGSQKDLDQFLKNSIEIPKKPMEE